MNNDNKYSQSLLSIYKEGTMRIIHFTLIGLCLVLSVSVAMAKEKQPAEMKGRDLRLPRG